MSSVPTLAFTRGKLPHWLVADRSLFVTVCRKGCIPVTALDAMRRSAKAQQQSRYNPEATDQRFLAIEKLLDEDGSGERDLCNAHHAAVVIENFEWLKSRGWRIWAASLMPSHLHLVMENTLGKTARLGLDMGQFKSFTGERINKLHGTTGSYWQRECFDHWCRDGDDWLRFTHYTVLNPVKAGLVARWQEWPYTVVDDDIVKLIP